MLNRGNNRVLHGDDVLRPGDRVTLSGHEEAISEAMAYCSG